MLLNCYWCVVLIQLPYPLHIYHTWKITKSNHIFPGWMPCMLDVCWIICIRVAIYCLGNNTGTTLMIYTNHDNTFVIWTHTWDTTISRPATCNIAGVRNIYTLLIAAVWWVQPETHERETYKVFPTFLSPNCNLQPAVSLLIFISQSSNWYHYKVCALLCWIQLQHIWLVLLLFVRGQNVPHVSQ